MGSSFWLRFLVFAVVIGTLAIVQPVLAVLAVLVGIAIAAAGALKANRSRYADSPTEGLSLDAQARLRPLLEAQRKIAEVTERNANHPIIKVIGEEALTESNDIIAKASGLLKARAELLRSDRPDRAARSADLRARIQATNDLQERERLESALALTESALEHDRTRDEALANIEAQLDEARAALEQTHAELTSALADDFGAGDQLRETLGRLQSLGSSLEEAQDLLRETP